MESLYELLRQDHEYCDVAFNEAEEAAAKANFNDARASFNRFRDATDRHLRAEEEILFPPFEDELEMTNGPTAVMRSEHKIMRDLLARMDQALVQQSVENYLGLSDTLLILMQQHNLKEENMLYHAMDNVLVRQRDALLAALRAAGIEFHE